MQALQLSDKPLIFSGTSLGETIQKWLNRQIISGIFILVDENAHLHCLTHLTASVPLLKNASVLKVEAGEGSKSPEIAMDLWKTMLEQGADRKSLLINLGGGVVGDLGGFVASVFMRGIRFVQIPTTLLAQVDASVGGKTGINFSGIKNMLGTFQQPEAVFADSSFLESLPGRELISGFAEVVKHALIAGNEAWETIKKTDPRGIEDWSGIVADSILQKKKITDADFRESGLREVLNLGHTAAHALESLYFKKNKQLMHGDAVAAGIRIESHLAVLLNLLDEAVYIEVDTYIRKHFPAADYEKADIPELMSSILKDKKNRLGRPAFSLLQKIGNVVTGQTAPEELILKAFTEYPERR